ncbi:hypothetical protein CFAM422_011423 [Trichoderma lentiforme]|uniref:Uncharacterized protein n=1 Tax=Trichoderma lentiforme TaxID=1567552 RepID=A0A9P4X5S7_9HYPO|nr:hypothetical protein CFAM422_011423 [Trichoderma lentiforme]
MTERKWEAEDLLAQAQTNGLGVIADAYDKQLGLSRPATERIARNVQQRLAGSSQWRRSHVRVLILSLGGEYYRTGQDRTGSAEAKFGGHAAFFNVVRWRWIFGEGKKEERGRRDQSDWFDSPPHPSPPTFGSVTSGHSIS